MVLEELLHAATFPHVSVQHTVYIQWRHYVSVGPGARNNLGPHKVMTYINGAGGFSTKNIFEFKVSEMAFPAF